MLHGKENLVNSNVCESCDCQLFLFLCFAYLKKSNLNIYCFIMRKVNTFKSVTDLKTQTTALTPSLTLTHVLAPSLRELGVLQPPGPWAASSSRGPWGSGSWSHSVTRAPGLARVEAPVARLCVFGASLGSSLSVATWIAWKCQPCGWLTLWWSLVRFFKVGACV